MRITSDWHIHSGNSCDDASLVVADLIREAEAASVRAYGLTDHLHTPYNLPDIAASREEYDRSDPPPQFHFGIEVSSVSRWELDEIAAGRHAKPTYGLRSGGPLAAPLAIGISQEHIDRFGIEFVVAGTHWPMYVPLERQAVIRDYHRQNLFLATHPLVDIVAHPWWWMGAWQGTDGKYAAEPWFDDFGCIPRSMHDEFASAAVEHGTAVEINLGAILLNPEYPEHFTRQYLDYLAYLKSRRVALSIGSDCHARHYEPDLARAGALLDSVGIGEADLWELPPRARGAAPGV